MSIISPSYFPERLEERQTIVILSDHEFEEAMKSRTNGKFLLDDKVCYMKKPTDIEVREAKQPLVTKMNERGLLQSGKVLLLDDSNQYQSFDKVLKATIQKQMTTFVEL